ncbi:tyrosine-type recombinase/integrase [Halorubrum vacuolatum]|uniref:Site-specific recombinase XerD n=1 Tax=Halorubrum vacuolatum TaxID=63740 RepID=A0A238VYN6_HALVU|nr:tyrosine-type recombinase/integrase [Halorubrum vacuolatum]SNR39465.1 Site-specific recombinase XerD [Halorubrum vacuolatum]
MGNDPQAEYDRTVRRIVKEYLINETLSRKELEAIEEYILAKNPDIVSISDHEGGTLKKQTLATYGDHIRICARRLEPELTECTTKEINEFMDSQLENLSKSTVQLYQCALISFYRYHDIDSVDPDKIVIIKYQTTKVDENDVFTREDIRQMRNVIQNDRDRAIFELLLNTGQRIRAIQSLRIKDIKPKEGVFYLNTEAEGLKGADKQSRKRPLLGARKACLDWLQKHPTKQDPESAFITHLPSQETRYGDIFGKPLSGAHINRRLKRIGKDAGIRKPTNAHNFRHTFVTIAKRDYDLDDATIKFIIGHSPDSTVMETTYSHLSADDHISKAEVAAGIKEKASSETLTPDICPTCYENLDPSDKACSNCGEIFALDAQETQRRVQSDIYESAKQTTTQKDQSALDQLKNLIEENPELLEELTD